MGESFSNCTFSIEAAETSMTIADHISGYDYVRKQLNLTHHLSVFNLTVSISRSLVFAKAVLVYFKGHLVLCIHIFIDSNSFVNN